MKFKKNYTVKWHDTGFDGTATPSRIFGYMQETASLHCRSLGHDLDELYQSKGLGFIVVRFSVEILSPLYAQDEITVDTWVPESHGLSFNRCYEIRRDGEPVARGISVSALLDTNTHRFCRVTDYDFGFEITPEVEVGIPTRLRFAADQSLTTVGTRRIYASDLDYNLHMNNTNYPDMLADFLPDRTDRRVMAISLSYLHEARYGDVLTVLCGNEKGDETGNVFCLCVTREDGTPVTEARIVTEIIQSKNFKPGDT